MTRPLPNVLAVDARGAERARAARRTLAFWRWANARRWSA